MALDGSLDVTVGDDAVTCTLTVENVGDDDLDLAFRSGKVADFAVLDGDREVWRYSDDRMFTQALHTETLAAGAAESFDAEWPDPDPGEYVCVATLESDPGLEVREPFSV